MKSKNPSVRVLTLIADARTDELLEVVPYNLPPQNPSSPHEDETFFLSNMLGQLGVYKLGDLEPSENSATAANEIMDYLSNIFGNLSPEEINAPLLLDIWRNLSAVIDDSLQKIIAASNVQCSSHSADADPRFDDNATHTAWEQE